MDSDTIVFMVLCVLFFLGVVGLVLTSINRTYCYIFLHEKWKLWKKIYKNIDGAVFVSHYQFEDHPHLDNYHFRLYIGEEEYTIIAWTRNNSDISVYRGKDITNVKNLLLTGYNKHYARKVKKKLMANAALVEMIQEQLDEK